MNLNLTLNPSQSEYILKPGASLTQAFDVTNNSPNTVYLYASIQSWQPQGSLGSVAYLDTLPTYLQFSLGNANLKLNQIFPLQPQEKKQLLLKIRSESATPPTDTYLTFFINQPASSMAQPQTTARIGSHILLSHSASADLASSLHINHLSVKPLLKDFLFSRLSFDALVTNDSDFYTKTEGKLIVSKNDKTIKELTLYPHNVLSHHQRSLRCLTSQEKPDSIPCTLSSPFWPGLYTATLSLTNSDSVSVKFFIFPFSLLGLLIPLFLLFIYLKQKKEKQGGRGKEE